MRIPRCLRDLQVWRESRLFDFSTTRLFHGLDLLFGERRQELSLRAVVPGTVFPREGVKGWFDTRSWFQPCLQDAEIVGYVWHSNRRTFCSWLAMAGASIKEIQEAAGHKTITMSARYSHLFPAHRQSAVERIAETAIKQPPAAVA